MCSTVIFEYRCGCTERVVFKCPFSSATVSSSSNGPGTHTHRDCSRHYQRHQRKLLPPRRTTKSTASPSPSHEEQSPYPITMNIPISTHQAPYPQIEENARQDTSETAMTEIDDICHDCWQRELRLVKQRDDDGNSLTTTTDGEEQEENPDEIYVLREMSPNELILFQPSVSSEARSSAESVREE
ncbi:hypothetical protein F5Y07DRAFT_291252 [Xylaria sp. FL0933]|nr:hypothetical protein F5Y07DRAFT_291252 [Xylaria sp. FL0933]